MHYTIHILDTIWRFGGILSSTGFKVENDNNEMFLDDDGNGNVRRYYLVSGVKTYANETQGTN